MITTAYFWNSTLAFGDIAGEKHGWRGQYLGEGNTFQGSGCSEFLSNLPNWSTCTKSISVFAGQKWKKKKQHSESSDARSETNIHISVVALEKPVVHHLISRPCFLLIYFRLVLVYFRLTGGISPVLIHHWQKKEMVKKHLQELFML